MTIQLNLQRWTEIVILAACIFMFGMTEGMRRTRRQLEPQISAQSQEIAEIQATIAETQATQARIDQQMRACEQLIRGVK